MAIWSLVYPEWTCHTYTRNRSLHWPFWALFSEHSDNNNNQDHDNEYDNDYDRDHDRDRDDGNDDDADNNDSGNDNWIPI